MPQLSQVVWRLSNMSDDSGMDLEKAQRELREAAERLQGKTPREEKRRKPEFSGPPYCSFCGKSKGESGALIAGPSVYICEECVQECNRILEERNEKGEGA